MIQELNLYQTLVETINDCKCCDIPEQLPDSEVVKLLKSILCFKTSEDSYQIFKRELLINQE